MFNLMKPKDMLIDKHGELREYLGPCTMKEKRDGRDFNYPGCMLKNIFTEEITVVAQSQIDLDYFLVHPEVMGFDLNSPNASDEYAKALTNAMNGNFHKEYTSGLNNFYPKVVASTLYMVNSFAAMKITKELPPKTKELLHTFGMFILLYMDAQGFKLKKDLEEKAKKEN